MEAAGPTECVLLFAIEFLSIHFETGALLPSYGQWLEQADLQPAYDTHRRAPAPPVADAGRAVAAQVAGAPDGPRRATATYLGARTIWTHRDPLTVLASVASLNTLLHSMSTAEVDPVAVGEEWAPKLAMLLDRGCEFRDRAGDDAFHDLDYRDLVNDPSGP